MFLQEEVAGLLRNVEFSDILAFLLVELLVRLCALRRFAVLEGPLVVGSGSAAQHLQRI